MFENATVLHIQPGKTDAALCVLREAIVPVLKAQPGLKALALLPNAAADQITVLSLWGSEAAARAVEAQCVYRREVAQLDALLAAPPLPTPNLRALAHPRNLLVLN